MGQKVSSLSFRSRTFPYYKNIWQFSKDLTYKHNLNLSLYIKTLVQELIDNLDILGIRIKFYNKFYIKLNIILPKSLSTSSTSSLYLNPLSLKYLNTLLNLKSVRQLKEFNKISKYKVSINFCVLKEPLLNPEILNYFITSQLKKGEPIRKILKQLSQFILGSREVSSIGGLKLLISGRIGGIQRARKESLLIGNVPLQTLNYQIKYSSSSIKTSYGTLGIKLWLFTY
uniref:Rps3 n=1 Tax=Apicomplexa sp. WK-2018_Corallicola TaxID=2304055 RepID=A0A346KN94_9APIC|nr:Rps3 [Apicomplexa sp. WK-2018_Corallicola]